MNIKKILTYSILFLFLMSSCIFAVEEDTVPSLLTTAAPVTSAPLTISDDVTSSVVPNTTSPQEINEDLYIYNTDSYTISDNIYGNVFASTNKFVINPRNGGGSVSGDIFAIASNFVIESDVTYSDKKDVNNNYIISSVNSKSIVNGNVYAFSENFVLESGSKITGDLYVYSTNVTIEQDAIIGGNVYIVADDVTFNGQFKGSAYVKTANFDMTFHSYIIKDLFLNCTDANLAGIIYRNAYITADNSLTTQPDFFSHQDLTVNFAKDFTFSGQVKGNVKVNATNFNFENSEGNSFSKCSIAGNLNYACKNEVTIPDGVVSGAVTTSDYLNKTSNKFSFTSTFIQLIEFLICTFAIIFLAKFFAPKCIEKLSKLTVKNTLFGLGIGLISIFAVVLAFILLLLTGVGLTLGLALLVAYIFVCIIALPLLLLTIADMLKLKWNIYLKVLLVTFVYFVISIIPFIGSILVPVAILVGIGRILLCIFNRKK